MNNTSKFQSKKNHKVNPKYPIELAENAIHIKKFVGIAYVSNIVN